MAALLYALTSLGYSRLYWPASWPAHWLDMASTVFSCLAVSAAIHFHVVLIRDFDPPNWVRRIHRVLLLLMPLKLLLLPLGMTILALRINMFEVLLAPMVFFISAWQARGWRTSVDAPRPLLPRWTVLGFYAILCAMLLMAALPALGLSQGGEIPLYVVQAHGLVTAFLVLLMLQYRARVQLKLQGETAMALERSRMQVQQERQIREEHEKLLAMLAHELRTPLATMQMRLDPNAIGSRDLRNAIRDMNAVIERCIQTNQLGDRQLQAQLSAVDIGDLVRDAVATCQQPERINLHGLPALTVRTDRQLLFIALGNLLENACKYAAPDTPIELHVDIDGSLLRLRIGNAPGQAGWPDPDKLFDKYYRSPHARRQAGTGLGLYLVRNLAEVLGGRVDYRPARELLWFELTLPLAPETR